MKTRGVRILMSKGNIIGPTLSDIIVEIVDGESFHWAILFLDGNPNRGEWPFLVKYQEKINHSENGIPIQWSDFIPLSNRYFQMFETIIIGCKDEKLLRRYEDEKEMYTTCDIVIDLIDCVFWEIYSKDHELLNRLQKKFQEVKILNLDS